MKGHRDNQVTLEDCVELFSKEYVCAVGRGVVMVTMI